MLNRGSKSFVLEKKKRIQKVVSEDIVKKKKKMALKILINSFK